MNGHQNILNNNKILIYTKIVILNNNQTKEPNKYSLTYFFWISNNTDKINNKSVVVLPIPTAFQFYNIIN